MALRTLKVSYSDVGEGGVAMNCEKNTFFPEHPVLYFFRGGAEEQYPLQVRFPAVRT